MSKIVQKFTQSTKLISLDGYFDEMVTLYEKKLFPKVLLLNGKKGIGKFTLVFHFLNYIYSRGEKTSYNIEDKLINKHSNFYNSLLKKTCLDVIFLQAEEGKNIKIEDIRNLKSILSRSSLSDSPRFTIIDDVEFLNTNSANALLKTLEEPTLNNYFILINNQQANLLETISSRCLKNNIYLNSDQRKKVIDHLVKINEINISIDKIGILTPGVLISYAELSEKYNVEENEDISTKIHKILYAYKKDKNKLLISMSIFLVNQFFYILLNKNKNKIDFLLNIKSIIVDKINDFIMYNLNINSVLNSIDLKLKNVRE